MRRLLLFCFNLLYHSLAWGYDGVSWIVSLGRWATWRRSILPFAAQGRILELGFGTGHLQIEMGPASVYGIDASPQMTRLAQQRILSAGYQPRLSLAYAQCMPFASESFSTIVSTFPAPYIFSPQTSREIQRLLQPGGRFLILLAARPSGGSLSARWVRFVFWLTGQSPRTPRLPNSLIQSFLDAGLAVHIGWKEVGDDEILLLEGSHALEKPS